MLQMDLPHLNVLTKIDNLSSYGPLAFNLDYYTEVQDLNYLLPHLAAEAPAFDQKFQGLNKAITELVEDFALVGFETLAIEDKKSMMKLLQAVDKAGGYAFGSAEGANDTVWQVAVREGMTTMDINDVQERWVDVKDEYDEKERRELEEQAEARKARSQDPARPGEDDEDEDEDEDMEEMQRPLPDSGIKVVRKT